MTALIPTGEVQEVQCDVHLLREAPRVTAATAQVIRAPSPAGLVPGNRLALPELLAFHDSAQALPGDDKMRTVRVVELTGCGARVISFWVTPTGLYVL